MQDFTSFVNAARNAVYLEPLNQLAQGHKGLLMGLHSPLEALSILWSQPLSLPCAAMRTDGRLSPQKTRARFSLTPVLMAPERCAQPHRHKGYGEVSYGPSPSPSRLRVWRAHSCSITGRPPHCLRSSLRAGASKRKGQVSHESLHAVSRFFGH